MNIVTPFRWGCQYFFPLRLILDRFISNVWERDQKILSDSCRTCFRGSLFCWLPLFLIVLFLVISLLPPSRENFACQGSANVLMITNNRENILLSSSLQFRSFPLLPHPPWCRRTMMIHSFRCLRCIRFSSLFSKKTPQSVIKPCFLTNCTCDPSKNLIDLFVSIFC